MDELRKAQQNGVVLGLKGLSSQPIFRRDIDDLIVNYPETFNLFLLALSELQKDEQIDNKMGYQQIAGIHGLPTSPWDNITGPNRERGDGYCSHGNPTFPTWHRPYLAMMEQTIYDKMDQIVSKYKGDSQTKYRKALEQFRLPFWDYYRPRAKRLTPMPGVFDGSTSFPYDFSLPQIFCVPTVMVRYPDDDTMLKSLDNPLYNHKFSKLGAKDNAKGMTAKDWKLALSSWKSDWGTDATFSQDQTVRYPASITDSIGNQTRQSYVLNTERENQVKSIMNMIRDDAYANYATFASTSIAPGGLQNLEGIHGFYHMAIGGNPRRKDPATGVADRGGHMSHVPTAAYDPVFWMHHCLIDRWTAIWQAARPDHYYDGKYYTYPNGWDKPKVVTEVSTLINADHLPFRHPKGGFWNGTTSQDTKTFGYMYKEAIGSPEQVKKRFYDLYRWAMRQDPREQPGTPPEEMKPFPVLQAQVFDYTNLGTMGRSLRDALEAAPLMPPSAIQSSGSAPQEALSEPKIFAQTAESVDIQVAAVAPGTVTSEIAFTNIADTPMAAPVPEGLDESKYYRDWYVDHQVKRLALNGSFAIYWFIGNIETSNSDDYLIQPTNAGINYVFAASREACDNCGQQDDDQVLVGDTKIITPMLMDYILKDNEPLQDLTPEHVVPFLVKNLKWRIVASDGQAVDPRIVEGFKIGVSSKLGPRDPDSQEPSIYEEYPQVVEEIIRNAS